MEASFALCPFASSTSTISKIISFSNSKGHLNLIGNNGLSLCRWPLLVRMSCDKHQPSSAICSSLEASSAFPYESFIHFALEETKRHTELLPSPLQNKYNSLLAMDGNTELEMLSFETPKIRLLRSLSVKGKKRKSDNGKHVFDFAVFPRPEFDLPIFVASFFTGANTNIVVLDLNPLHNVINRRDYKEKYYRGLIPLGLKYAELLPWGGKLTGESLQFFSPIVIWTKFSSSPEKYDALFSAFKDYYKAWLELMLQAAEETEISQVMQNQAAQHKYLVWRAGKDPGYGLLKSLLGGSHTKELINGFLFNGVLDLGNCTFGDYFPEYKREDGSIIEKRSVIGKMFEKRPWDANGEYIGLATAFAD